MYASQCGLAEACELFCRIYKYFAYEDPSPNVANANCFIHNKIYIVPCAVVESRLSTGHSRVSVLQSTALVCCCCRYKNTTPTLVGGAKQHQDGSR